MSVLSYGGIILPYANTSRFEQSVRYEEVGNTDWYCTEFNIQVQCIINADYLSIIDPTYANVTTANAATIMSAIRTNLMKPRQTLSFTCNGVELIPQRQSSGNGLAVGVGTVDAQNGPKPQFCSIVQLTNTTFVLNYGIIAHYWENNEVAADMSVTNKRGNNVLYNRWTETVDIDNCMYSRRTREGKFGIRSDNASGKMADEIRSQMAVTSCPQGFVRESYSFTITPDGLAIQYRITDREVFKMPPKPAYEADGYYIESTTQRGAIKYGEVYLKLRGCKDKFISPQDELVNVAAAVASAKLAINGAKLRKDGRGFALLEYGEVKVGMYDNWVEIRLRAMLTGQKSRLQGTTLGGKSASSANMVFTPASEDGTQQPFYKDRGTASLLLQAARYYDPNLPNLELGPGPVSAPELNRGNRIGNDSRNQLSDGVDIGRGGIVREN